MNPSNLRLTRKARTGSSPQNATQTFKPKYEKKRIAARKKIHKPRKQDDEGADDDDDDEDDDEDDDGDGKRFFLDSMRDTLKALEKEMGLANKTLQAAAKLLQYDGTFDDEKVSVIQEINRNALMSEIPLGSLASNRRRHF